MVICGWVKNVGLKVSVLPYGAIDMLPAEGQRYYYYYFIYLIFFSLKTEGQRYDPLQTVTADSWKRKWRHVQITVELINLLINMTKFIGRYYHQEL